MKRIAFIAVFLFAGLGVFSWFAQSYANAWEPTLRRQLEQRLGKTLHAKVHIESIALSFVHQIALTNVSIWDTESQPPVQLFRAQEVSLTLSLIDLVRAFTHHNPLEAIGRISLESPVVVLSPHVLRQHAGPHPRQSLPILFALEWDHGTVQWSDPQRGPGAHTLYQSHGFFKIRGPNVDASVIGSLDAVQSIQLRFSSLGRYFLFRGDLLNGNLEGVAALAQQELGRPILPEGWRARGRFDLTVRGRGRLPWAFRNTASWVQEARLRFDNAELQGPTAAPPIHLHGALLMKGSNLLLSQLWLSAAGTRVKLSGQAKPLPPNARLDVHAVSRDVDLAVLSRYLATGRAAGLPSEAEPLVSGKGSFELALQGALSQPDLELNADILQGNLFGRAFDRASIHALRRGGRWEFPENVLQKGASRITLSGVASRETLALQITGDALSLKDFVSAGGVLQGDLKFSLTLRGSPQNPEAAGSYWVNNLAWGTPHPESLEGEFQISNHQFQTHGISEDSAVQLQAQGRCDAGDCSLQSASLRLRSGASVLARGTSTSAGNAVRGTFEAHDLSLAEDFPNLLSRWPSARGKIDLRGRLEGTLGQPRYSVDLQGTHVTLGQQPLASVSASIEGDVHHLQVNSFHLDPGYSGSLFLQRAPRTSWGFHVALDSAPAAFLSDLLRSEQPFKGTLSGDLSVKSTDRLQGGGTLAYQGGRWGAWSLDQSSLRYTLEGTHLEIPQWTIKTSHGDLTLKGRAFWENPREKNPLQRVGFHAEGQAVSTDGGSLWTVPLRLSGQADPSDHWSGQLTVHSSAVVIREAPSEPFDVHVHWDPQHLIWEQARWGSAWSSEGMIRFKPVHATLAGKISADQVSLEQWQYWLWPKTHEPVRGVLNGQVTLQGLLSDPSIRVAAALTHARWRAFEFQSALHGTWSHGGLEPADASGDFTGGGHFDFHGRLAASNGVASGMLQLSQINLHMLGKSLSFPKPLQGLADGTFTVNGPLNQLVLKGHLEGASLCYGDPQANPFRMQSGVMDLELGPAPEISRGTRLTLNKAVVKTAEEEIRLNPGSFVEFGGSPESQLQISSEIRNLHLGVFTLFGGLDFQGSWQIKPEGFALQGDAWTRSLYINDYELEEGHVKADYYNRIIRFTPPPERTALVTGTLDFQESPQLRFTDFSISGKEHQGVQISGDVGPARWDFRLKGQGIDLRALSSLAGFSYPLEGSANVSIQGTGDQKHPQVSGQMDAQDGRVLGLDFQTGSAAFLWQGNRMTLTRLELSDPGRYTLRGGGVFPLAASTEDNRTHPTIDFSVRLEGANLGLLKSISSEVKGAKGPVEGLLQVRGTPDNPVLGGSLRVRNGEVVGAHYFRHLEDFFLAADFVGGELRITELRGKSGKGEFRGGGHISFAGFQPQYYDLTLSIPSSKGIEVQVPELAIPESPLAKKFHFLTTASRCDAKGQVAFKGPADSPDFTGEALLTNGHFTFPPSTKNPPPPAFLEWISRVNWNADLKFGEGAWFENELVEAAVTGHVHLQGTSDHLKVDGGLDISEGKISYLGVDFDIHEARFDIRPQVTGTSVVNVPYVRGTADSEVQIMDPVTNQPEDDTIHLTIDYAPINEIKPRLVSANDPTLPQDKVLMRVANLDVTNLTPQQRTLLYQQQMVRLVDTSLATPLANSLLRRTGLVDQVTVSQKIAQGGTIPNDTALAAALAQQQQQQQQQNPMNLLAGTKYTLSKNINTRLSLGYGLRFEPYQTLDLQNRLDLRSDVELSYRLMQNFYLKGSFDLPSAAAGTLPENVGTIERRWRFGWWGHTNPPKPPSAKQPTQQ